jgi:outer membrane beta-barrel protein
MTCLALSTAVLAAGGEKGNVEVGIFGGYGFLDQYEGSRFDFRQLVISDDDLNPEDDLLIGFRVGHFLTSTWSLEGSFQRLSTEASFDTCVAEPCPGSAETRTTVDADLDSVRVNLLYNWREGARIRPFLAVGAGWEGTDIEDVMDEDDLGLNAGVGVRFFLGDHIQIRLENRFVYTEVSDPVDGGQSNFETQVGFSWTFGGASVPEERPEAPDEPGG